MEQWDEFNNKYGFDGGACVTPADFRARKYIVKAINERLAALDSKDIRLVEWDRPGFHNPCMIVISEWNGKMFDEELLRSYQRNEVDEVEDFDPSDLIGLQVELFPNYFAYLTPLVALVAWLVAFGFWSFGLRHYQSSGT
jgi:hypothetical protein